MITNSPTKLSSLDPIPAFLLKECRHSNVLLAFLATVCNAALTEDVFYKSLLKITAVAALKYRPLIQVN